MSDLFHDAVPDAFIAQVFDVMQRAERHTFQILTKRPERMARLCRDLLPLLPNVWLGTSVEHQAAADERIPLLLDTPAAVRFLSCEPLLSDIDLSAYLCLEEARQLDWVIVGGESGEHYRPMDLDWARSIREQCQTAGIAYFFKQSNGLRPGMGRELDGRLWEEYPA